VIKYVPQTTHQNSQEGVDSVLRSLCTLYENRNALAYLKTIRNIIGDLNLNNRCPVRMWALRWVDTECYRAVCRSEYA